MGFSIISIFLSFIYLIFWMTESMMMQLISFLLFTIINCVWIINHFSCILTPFLILLSIVSGLIVILSFVMMMYPNSPTNLHFNFNLFFLYILFHIYYINNYKYNYLSDHLFSMDQFSQSSDFIYSPYLFLFIFFISLMFFILFIIDWILNMGKGGSFLLNK